MKIKMYKINVIIIKNIVDGVLIFINADKYIPVGNDNSKPHFRSPSEMYKSMGYGLREYVKVKP